MSALPRPDLPAGPHRDLVDALHELHHRAGWPSLRALARDAGVSHTTVSHVFSSSKLPSWGTVELLVEAMGGDTANFHQLWLAASAPDGEAPAAPAIAGRRAELTVVRRRLEAGTGLLLVTGEAGIGKTKLVTTAAASADTFVAMGHCLPLSTEVPLLPIADCLRSVYDDDGGAWFGKALSQCPPYVASSISLLLPEAALPVGDTTVRAEDRQLLLTSLGAVLRALAAIRPIAVLLEDLHWADPATLDMLEHLLGRGSPITVLGSWRTDDDTTPESSHAWFARVRRVPDATVLELGPLSRDETTEQLVLLGAGSPEQVEWIHARSQGQPLFTEQLAAHLDEAPALPGLLADLLDRRLDGLSEPGWAVLRTLGVAERPLAPALVARVSGLTPDQLTPELRGLQDRRLLQPAAGAAVQLRHPLLADAVQRRLVVGEDTAVHRSLAEALGEQADAEAAEVAAHWLRAEDPEREVGWRIAAARGAATRFDRRQEADHWQRALEIWPGPHDTAGDPPATRADVYIAAMDALRMSFRWERAAAMSDAAEEVLGELSDATRAELFYRAAEYRGRREGRHVDAQLTDEALRLFDRMPVCEGKVRALDHKQTLVTATGRFRDAGPVLHQAISAAEELGNPALLRDLLMQEAWNVGLEGDAHKAMSLLSGCAARAGVGNDPLGDIRQSVYATDLMLACGAEVDVVTAAGQSGLSVAREQNIDNLQVLLVRSNMVVALLRAGRVSEAGDLIAVTRDEPVDLGRWWLHAVRAVMDVALGDIPAAQQRVEAIIGLVAGDIDRDLEFLTAAASVDCWAGTPGPALERLLNALEAVVGLNPVRLLAPGLLVAARCAADLAALDPEGSVRQDAAELQRLASLADVFGEHNRHDTHLAAHAATFAAELARLSRRDQASAWTGAAGLWDRLTRPHDAAYCRWRGAQVALREGQGTVAARLLKKAAKDAREHVPLLTAIRETAG